MKKQSGFTLIELLVTLAVFTMLVALAVPNLQAFMRSNRLTSSTNLLVVELNLDRSEAVKRGTTIKTCVSNADQTNCDGVSTSWENGWITFIDTNGDDAVSAGETVLRVKDNLRAGTTIRSAEFTNIISFNSDGSSSGMGAFRICDDENNNVLRARGINIAATGIISLARDTDAVPDDTVNIFTAMGNITCP